MTAAYSYDLNGNQTSRGINTLAYDHQNRLTKINPPNTPIPDDPCYDVSGDDFVDGTDNSILGGVFGKVEAFYNLDGDPGNFVDGSDNVKLGGQFGRACPNSFTYDGDGLRTARGGSWLSSQYVWDTAASLPVILKETDSHNAANGQGVDNTYVYGLGLISMTDRSGNQAFYTSDGLGSTTDLTNSQGMRTDGYTYDAFGTPTHSPGSSANPFQFTGQQRDADSGLQYLRARYYDPGTGRFLGKDPLPGQFALPITQNRYTYAYDNPALFTDPSGLCGGLDCLGDAVDTGISIGKQAAPWVGACGAGLVYAPATLTCIAKIASTFLPLDDVGYVDLNLTGCLRICGTGGAQISLGDGIHPYFGSGVGNPQFSGNLTFGPGQHITTGPSCGVQVSVGDPGVGPAVTGQFGGSGIHEDKEGWTSSGYGELGAGFGVSGGISWAATCIYIF